MNDMMRACGEWMTSLGWVGMALGVVVLAAVLVLIVMLIARMKGSPRA